MDDFQLRLLRALERLAGRDGGVVGGGPVAAPGPTLMDRLGAISTGLIAVQESLDRVIAVMEEIRDGMPGPPPGGGGGGPP